MKDLEKAFSFPFKDPAWPSKFLLAALFMLLSIFLVGIFILAGYFIQVTQRVMRKEEQPMPEWSDVGVMLVVGFKFCITYVIYLLPVLILYIPFVVLVVMQQLIHNGGAFDTIAGLYLIIVIFALILPYCLLLTLLSPIIAYRFAEREKISDALDVGGIVQTFKRNWQNTAIVAVIGVGISTLSALGIIVFLVGWLVTVFYAYLVMSYMSGLLYLAQEKEELPA